MITPTSTRTASSAATDTVIEALFAEARRRRRRIRLAGTGAVAAIAAIALAVGLARPWLPGGPRHEHRAGPSATRAIWRAGHDPLLVWASSDWNLVIGNLRTMSWRSVTGADVDFSAPLVPYRRLIYWVKESGGYVDGADWPRVVEALNPATGESTIVAPGQYVIPSADGQTLYAAETDTSVAELPTRPGQRLTQLTVPAGWYLPGGAGMSVANGITVQSRDVIALAHPSDLGVWNPRTGHVQLIGRAIGAITAYTPAGADYSLLAWSPAGCRMPSCSITISDTATLASHTLRSPLGHGFVLGGAFSPNGQYLAVFVNDSAQADGETADLAIVTTATGAVRIVPGVRLTVGEDADWIRWLPGGKTLITLANRNYLVNATTLAIRPFDFTSGGQDIDATAQLIPAAGR